MRPIYLKFANEAEWLKLSTDDKYAALTPVVIGEIVKPPAAEGAKSVVIAGCHVNMLGDLPEELTQFEVFPTTPSCVYGGWSPEDMKSSQGNV